MVEHESNFGVLCRKKSSDEFRATTIWSCVIFCDADCDLWVDCPAYQIMGSFHLPQVLARELVRGLCVQGWRVTLSRHVPTDVHLN